MKKALIINIFEENSIYLVNLLINTNYKVYILEDKNICIQKKQKNNKIEFIDCNILELTNIKKTIAKIKPNEIYNFSNIISQKNSFKHPVYNFLTNGISVLYILEAIKNIDVNIKFSQIFINEDFLSKINIKNIQLQPGNPVETAKLYAYNMIRFYREYHGLFCYSCNILNTNPLELDNFAHQIYNSMQK